MAYRDFTLADLKNKFGINNQVTSFLGHYDLIEPSVILKDDLEDAENLRVRSEKSKSEFIVVPILKELRRNNGRFFTIYSGEILIADAKKGLKGECDFILSRNLGTFDISMPIFQIVEAKKNDLELGVPQCAAQMVGAKIFNENKGTPLEKIYGCVTTGNEWQFLCLSEHLEINSRIYYLNELPEILAVFQHIIDYYKAVLK